MYDEQEHEGRDPDKFAMKEYDSACEHPTIEQMFMRQAVKYLTPKQKQVWELHNFDRLTQDEIGTKLGISHQAVCKHIRACEARITKYCRDNQGAYEVLKAEYGPKE
jgi:RNA polymerase sigma factor (sigma-70 family)